MHRQLWNYHALFRTLTNSLEQPIESQLVERITPEIAAFAAEGCRSWRESPIRVSILTSVPAVQVQLAKLEQSVELEGTDRAKQDLERDAIQAAIETAVKSLPHPYSSAALDRFGFTDDGLLPSGKGVLEGRAIRHFPKISTTRWWRKPQQKYCDLSPHDYVVALVSRALCGIADPIAHVASRGDAVAPMLPGGKTDKESLSSNVTRSTEAPSLSVRGRRWPGLALPMILACGVIAAAILIASGAFTSRPNGPAAGRTQAGGYSGPNTPRGWYPERAMSTCSSSNQCDGLAYVSLNATKFAEPIGRLPADERDFMTGEAASHSVTQTRSNRLLVVPGERIRVIGWVDNAASAARTPGGTRAATAVNTRFAAVLPSLPDRDIYLVGIASAGNAQPWRVGDSLTLVSKTKRPIAAHFVRGSVHLTASGRTYPLPDTTVGTYKPTHFSYRSELPTGTLIGCKGRNGLLPPGFSCAVSVSFEVEIANG